MPAASWPESCIPESLGTLRRPEEQVGKGPRTGRGRGVDKVQRQTASVLRTALSPGTDPHHHPESPGQQGSVGRGGTGERQRERVRHKEKLSSRGQDRSQRRAAALPKGRKAQTQCVPETCNRTPAALSGEGAGRERRVRGPESWVPTLSGSVNGGKHVTVTQGR